MATRPSQYPDFCLTGSRTAPSVPLTNTGYVADQIPLPTDHNYLFGVTGDWIRWLDQQEQLSALQFQYDATVGNGGTYADINALVAAITGGAPIREALVISNLTFSTTQVITSGIADLRLTFKKGTVMAKGASTTPGISVQGQRIDIVGARMSSFSGGSDVALQFESASKNCRALNNNFLACNTGVNDLGSNNEESGTIEEV